MSTKRVAIVFGLFSVVLFSCHKEYSQEGIKQVQTDSLPSDYPFATGFCKDGAASLGVSISDTVNYKSSDTNPLPASLFLDVPSPGDQSTQGSCAAWAVVYGAGTYNAHLTTGKAYSDTGNLSPKFTYNQIAKGDCGCTSVLDNLYLLQTQGACSLAAMPYNPQECLKQPDSLQGSMARSYKINGWQKVDLHNLILIKKAIVEKKPVIFAIRIDDGFQSLGPPYIWKERSGSLGDGHAMIITGFDDSKKAFRIMNSWSMLWGDKGFAWVDYNFFLQM